MHKHYYKDFSKYAATEREFRAKYPNAKIEVHWAKWAHARGKNKDVIDCQKLGFGHRLGKPGINSRIWIVARKEVA